MRCIAIYAQSAFEMTYVHNTSKPKHSAGCFYAIFALTRKRLAVKYCLNKDLLPSHGCKLYRVLQSDYTQCVLMTFLIKLNSVRSSSFEKSLMSVEKRSWPKEGKMSHNWIKLRIIWFARSFRGRKTLLFLVSISYRT